MKSMLLIITFYLLNTTVNLSAKTPNEGARDENKNLTTTASNLNVEVSSNGVPLPVVDPQLASNLYTAFSDFAERSGLLRTLIDVHGNVTTSFNLFQTLNCKRTLNSTTCYIVVEPTKPSVGQISDSAVARSLTAGILTTAPGVYSFGDSFEVDGRYERKGIFCTFNRFSCDINTTVGGLAYPDSCYIENQLTEQCV